MPSPELAAVLTTRIADLVAQAHAADRLVAVGDPEGVHDLRVSFRRLRSLLKSFGGVLSWSDAEELRDALARAGSELSGVRDLEVVAERVALDPDGAEVATHVATARAAEGARRHEPGYVAVLHALDGLADRPAAGTGDAGGILHHEHRRLVRRAAKAGLHDAAALHEVRKTAKRTRYAAETLEPLLGQDASAVADLARDIQEALGDHRDTLLVRGVVTRLRHVLDDPAAADRLSAREEAAGEAALVRYRTLRKRLRAPVD